jgi:hypothetical protein
LRPFSAGSTIQKYQAPKIPAGGFKNSRTRRARRRLSPNSMNESRRSPQLSILAEVELSGPGPCARF